jgi:hypothetical protein
MGLGLGMMDDGWKDELVDVNVRQGKGSKYRKSIK